MPFPLTIPVAIAAIKSLIRFRNRVDTILSLREATAELPFILPPLPRDDTVHISEMLNYFDLDPSGVPRNERGRAALELRGLVADFDAIRIDPNSPELEGKRKRLLDLYYEAGDVNPVYVGPPELCPPSRGASAEMRLAFYVVESQRLSRNPAAMRLLLAAADTVLEFAGANAQMFIADKRAQAIVATLLEEFAVKRDFDDTGGAHIFKNLLGAATVAVIQCPGELPDHPALEALVGALADVRNEMDAAGASAGTDFVAGFVSADGFQRLARRYLAHAAETPGLLPSNTILRPALAAMLKEAAQHDRTALCEPSILMRVLESGLGAASGPLGERINARLDGKPLAAAALGSVLHAVSGAAADHQLFRQIQNGAVLDGFYRAVLHSIAADPKLLASTTALDQFTAGLVCSFADALSKTNLSNVFAAETLQALTIRAMEQLAAHPRVIASDNEFAGRLLASTLDASAQALKDGLTGDDLVEIASAVFRTAANNVSLIEMDAKLHGVIAALASGIGEVKLSEFTVSENRKALLVTAVEAMATNPIMWERFADKDLVQPIVASVLSAFATDSTRLLSGPALVPATRLVLQAAARKGATLVSGDVTADMLEILLTRALEQGNHAIGREIDAETLPGYLERVVIAFLDSPLESLNNARVVNAWLRKRLSIA